MKRARALVLLAACAAGCSTASIASPPVAPDAGTAPPQASVADVIARTHVAFVGQDGAYASANERWRATYLEGALHVGRPDRDGELAIRTGAIVRGGWSCSGGEGVDLDDGTIVRTTCDGVREELVPSDEGVAIQWRFARAPEGDGDLVVRLDADGAERLERDASGGVRASAAEGAFALSPATWIDARGERTVIALETSGNDTVRVRVPADVLARSAYPALLDPTIGPEQTVDTAHPQIRGTGRHPSIAWNGAHFLVAFEEQQGSTTRYVRALRIDPSGVVLDELGIDVAATPSQAFPRVVWTGTQWVVSFLTNDGAWSMRLARIGADGTLIDTSAVPFGSLPGLGSEFDGVELAMVGSTLLAVWCQSSSVWMRRLDATTLAFLDAAPLEIGERFVSEARLASDGTRAVVAWRSTELRARIVAEDGTVGPILAPLPGVTSGTGIDVEWAGGQIALAYARTGGGMEVLRLAPDGTPVDAAPIVIYPTPLTTTVRLLWHAGLLHAAVWTTATASGRSLSRITIDGSGSTPVVSAPTEIGRTELSVHASAIQGGGPQVLAVWGGQQLLASRLDPAGTVLDTPAIPLHRTSSMQYVPALAWSGTHHVLAWRDDRADAPGVYVLRVGADGVPIDSLGVRAGGGHTSSWPHVLTVGSTTHIVYNELDPADGAYYLRARTIGPDLALGPTHTLDIGATASAYSIAANATSIRVAFLLGTPHTRAFGPDHEPIGPAVPLGLTTVADDLVLRASRNGWAVATIVDRGSNDELVVVRMRDDGVPIGTPVVLDTAPSLGAHDMAGDPGGFFVLWTRGTARWMARVLEDGTTGFRMEGYGRAPKLALGFHGGMHLAHVISGSYDDWLAFVRTDGTPRAAFEIASGRTMSQAAASSEPSGRTLVAFRVFDAASPYRNARVHVRLLTPDAAMGTPCTTGTACESGLCVDGVCCDQTCGGGVAGDCVACSAAAGAVTDGTCTPLGATVTCRASRGTCDAAEQCDGVAPGCPVDRSAANGTPCPDALVCDGAEVCMAGVCVAGAAPGCDLGDVCAAYSCVEPTGCVAAPVPGCCRSDAECDDGDGCTVDRCVSRACERTTAPACIDAGPPDSGPPDSGTDAGVDAGEPDAANDAGIDAGQPDAGSDAGGPGGLDAGVDAGVDAGPSPLDAGPLDAGSIDAGSIDAGSIDAASVDAGADGHVPETDAMSFADAAPPHVDAGTPPPPATGCSCRVAGRPATPGSPGLAIAMIAIVILVRRRA